MPPDTDIEFCDQCHNAVLFKDRWYINERVLCDSCAYDEDPEFVMWADADESGLREQ